MDKDNKYTSQLKRCEQYFKHHTATRYMASKATGIPIQNICRYCATLMKSNRMEVVRFGKCEVSKIDKVQFLTANPDKFLSQQQLSLWRK